MSAIKAYAAHAQGAPLELFEFSFPQLGADEIEIAVDYCGLCHSDLSMIDNEWGGSTYPLVAGHEVSGRVVAVGSHAKIHRVGDRVGLGWTSSSCMACPDCLSGDQNLCQNSESTIVRRFGGFAERVRCHWAWALPIPNALAPEFVGPLFCAGTTVFNAIVQAGVKPTDRVGVVGVGGLGHLALQFLNKWGCEVTAFSSSPDKSEELFALGAHHVVNSKDPTQFKPISRSLDFVLVTVNVPLDWSAYLQTLAPRGRLHFVGVVLEPLDVGVFSLLAKQRVVAASPVGSPSTTAKMLDFSARHKIAPISELFPMSKVNDAIARLKSGNTRFRIILKNDF